ncbi:MAG TPA: hypothetical protein DCX14_01635 [Flavobacteriales bacterium]|nr:hypothetical protein [Flavobacteriales bacterium]
MRITAPDFIKGLCIILMVYGHITMIGTLDEAQNAIKEFIYTFHMQIFLLVSGFFL